MIARSPFNRTSSYYGFSVVVRVDPLIRSRPSKPNQRKGQNEKFMNFAHFCEFWCFSLGKQARFTLNFCSGTPLRKVHELTFLVWFAGATPDLTEAKHVGLGRTSWATDPQYGWDFPEEIPEEFRNFSGNALRAFPEKFPSRVRLGSPQTL